MKLLTKAIEKRFAKIGRQEDVEDPIIIAKFFNPGGIGTWYATEFNPADGLFFGLCDIHEKEWGYFSLDELTRFRGRWGLGIERDLHFGEKRVSQLQVNN